MLFNVESSIGSVPRNADGWLMVDGGGHRRDFIFRGSEISMVLKNITH